MKYDSNSLMLNFLSNISDCLYDNKKENIILTIESGNEFNFFYTCPHCGIEVCVQKEEEKKLREIYENKILNYSIHNMNVRKYGLKDEEDGGVDMYNALLCFCPYCLLRSSALNIFRDD